MNKHSEPTRPADEQQVTLRSPAELADALPFLMGFHPSDSIVLVALHGDEGRFGGRLRLGIPRSPREWAPVSEQLAACLVEGVIGGGPGRTGLWPSSARTRRTVPRAVAYATACTPSRS